MKENKILFAELSLVVVTIIWGLGFPITKIAVNAGFGANSIMVGRFLTATFVLGIAYRKRLKNIDKNILKYGFITGIFLFLGFYFQTLGNVYTTPTKNGFITQLNIVFVPFLYLVFFRKKVDIYNILAVAIALCGMFVLSYTKGGFSAVNIGDIYTFICAIMIAFHVVTASFFQKKYDFDPALFVLINIVTSLLFSLLLMSMFEQLPKVRIIEYWPLLFLGVLNTALGFLVQSFVLKVSLPTRVSLIVTLESIFAAIASVMILNEELTYLIIIGGSLIIVGVVVNELKPFRKKRKLI